MHFVVGFGRFDQYEVLAGEAVIEVHAGSFALSSLDQCKNPSLRLHWLVIFHFFYSCHIAYVLQDAGQSTQFRDCPVVTQREPMTPKTHG